MERKQLRKKRGSNNGELKEKGTIELFPKNRVWKKEKFNCQLCDTDLRHMVVILNKGGDIHVHAPFDNKYLMNQFIEQIITEQKKWDLNKVKRETGR